MIWVAFIIVILLIVAAVALQSYLHKRRSNSDSLISAIGTVYRPLAPTGSVFISGELWLANSIDNQIIPEHCNVTVVGVSNHLLLVSRSEDSQ